MTAASLRSHTRKDLAQMAKRRGVRGWHSMRKDQLVRALVRSAQAKAAKSNSQGKKKTTPVRRAAGSKSAARKATTATSKTPQKPARPKPKSSEVARRIQKVNALREQLKDLALASSNGKPRRLKDRLVLMVRDPYWLHVVWELLPQSIQRAQAAMAEHWHTAQPILRLLEVDVGVVSNSSERVERDIEIHGGVKNWYIHVSDPPKSYRVDIGYLAAGGKYYSLARSNVVTTPQPGSAGASDDNWADVAANCEKVYTLSGGYAGGEAGGELQDLFEERLRRPMGSPLMTRYAAVAEHLDKAGEFPLQVDVDLLIYGATQADAYLTLLGTPLNLRPDGSFAVRLNLPNRRQVLPVAAHSADGTRQRTVVLAIDRNTKTMEPVIRESQGQ